MALVVVGSALAIGTVHRPALFAVAALALVGGALGAMAFRRLPLPAVVLAFLGIYSALQAVPLPASWAARLAPASAQVWLHCLAPFGEGELPRFALSLDPGASLAEALKWLTYASVYLMAARVRSRRGPVWLAALLFGSSALVALLTLAHGVADLRLLYGVYEPNFPIGRWNVGPLLNSNNFAGYAIIGLFAGLALSLSGHSPLPRTAVFTGIGVICTALLLSGSRAGVMSAVLAGGVVAVWGAKMRRIRPSATRILIGAAPLFLGAALAIGFGSSKNWAQLTSLDARRKIAVWEWSLPMIREHFWLGVGRGAFETAFPPYRQSFAHDWTGVAGQAENFVVQWISEWGVPVGMLATLALAAYALQQWYKARTDRVRFLLMCGFGALLLQNLADLGLEIPAVAIAAVVTLAAGAQANEPRPGEQAALGPALALGAPALALWVIGLIWSGRPVEVERRELSADYRALDVTASYERSSFRSELHRAMLSHPGEAFFPLLGSAVAYRAADQNALAWMARALELGPTNGRVHFVLAQFLGAHKATSQAMLHLRLAVEYDHTLSDVAAIRAAQWAPSLDLLLEAIPSSSAGNDMLKTACARTRAAFKADCFHHAIARSPEQGSLRGQLADALIVALRAGQPPCAGQAAEACAQEIERATRAMAKLDSRSWRPAYLMAQLLLVRGDPQGAATLLARACPPTAEGRDCAREAVTAALKSGAEDAIRAAADKYAARDCGTSASCAAASDWLGSTLEAAGKPALAITYYSKAAETEGTATRWLRVADRATKFGLIGMARVALEKADRSPDVSDNSRAHAELLRARLARSVSSR